MKCVINTKGTIKRVPDKKAHEMVRNSGWNYCPKSKWKAQVRKEDS